MSKRPQEQKALPSERPGHRTVSLADPDGSPMNATGNTGNSASAKPAENETFLGVDANSRIAWILPPLFLVAIGIGIAVIRSNPAQLFGLAFGSLVAAGLGWVIVSSFFPAKADRNCPQCGRNALRRKDRKSTHGLICRRCGWTDENASSFLLAEEEGPLEKIVLKQRRDPS